MPRVLQLLGLIFTIASIIATGMITLYGFGVETEFLNTYSYPHVPHIPIALAFFGACLILAGFWLQSSEMKRGGKRVKVRSGQPYWRLLQQKSTIETDDHTKRMATATVFMAFSTFILAMVTVISVYFVSQQTLMLRQTVDTASQHIELLQNEYNLSYRPYIGIVNILSNIKHIKNKGTETPSLFIEAHVKNVGKISAKNITIKTTIYVNGEKIKEKQENWGLLFPGKVYYPAIWYTPKTGTIQENLTKIIAEIEYAIDYFSPQLNKKYFYNERLRYNPRKKIFDLVSADGD